MINLRDNVNLWGPPPSSVAVLAGFEPEWIARYPGTDGGILAQTLARSLGIAESEISVGCGSDELIDAAFGLAAPGSVLVHADPTFAMVPIYARANRLRSIAVPYGPDGALDVERVLREAGQENDAGAAVVYLCSPNNPTGAAMVEADVETIVERAPGLVVLDGAYAEFCGGSDWASRAVRSQRLVVLRTFSKAWGLAGLRVGYAVGPAELIARLRANRGPFSVNAVAERVATAALELDQPWMAAHARQAAVNRDRLLEELRARGLRPHRSSANFVLLPVADAPVVAARLLERGIAVRPFRDLPGIGDAIRIGVGPWELLDRCLAALYEIVPCG